MALVPMSGFGSLISVDPSLETRSAAGHHLTSLSKPPSTTKHSRHAFSYCDLLSWSLALYSEECHRRSSEGFLGHP